MTISPFSPVFPRCSPFFRTASSPFSPFPPVLPCFKNHPGILPEWDHLGLVVSGRCSEVELLNSALTSHGLSHKHVNSSHGQVRFSLIPLATWSHVTRHLLRAHAPARHLCQCLGEPRVRVRVERHRVLLTTLRPQHRVRAFTSHDGGKQARSVQQIVPAVHHAEVPLDVQWAVHPTLHAALPGHVVQLEVEHLQMQRRCTSKAPWVQRGTSTLLLLLLLGQTAGGYLRALRSTWTVRGIAVRRSRSWSSEPFTMHSGSEDVWHPKPSFWPLPWGPLLGSVYARPICSGGAGGLA